MSNGPSLYRVEFLAGIERTISKDRLTRYLGATGQDVPRALQLYEYNVQLSEALYGLLHGLEVAVRNAEHHALSASYATASWYDTAPLSPYWQDELAKAKRKPGVRGAPGKIVAELTFGFWVELVAAQNHRLFWVNHRLHQAFPNARRHRKFIHERLKIIQLLRNRISHHEPVLTSRKTLYAGNDFITLPALLECVEWVCTETAAWMKTQFRYTDAERILEEVNASGISL
jgi:hypothetical protein